LYLNITVIDFTCMFIAILVLILNIGAKIVPP